MRLVSGDLLFCLSVAALVNGAVLHAATEEEILNLTSLESTCALVKREVGYFHALPFGAWLRCGETEMLMVVPLNLLDHVTIRNQKQALEFVRFFSSFETYLLFRVNADSCG